MSEAQITERLRRLPAVDRLLQVPPLPDLLGQWPKELVVGAVRAVLDRQRDLIRQGEEPLDAPALAGHAAARIAASTRTSLRRVINATGVVLHTNLGRAPLGTEAVEAIVAVAGGYSSLEMDLASGKRGERYAHVVRLLQVLTGAEDSLVVNNNAAAVLLVLHTLARGREVVVSRGQLVEIGGSFRIPEVMAASGATLVEVGTTNKTYLRDYEQAIGPQTAALLRVHTSNYRLVGFTRQVTAAELAGLGHRYGLPVIEDLGSGLLADLSPWGIRGEPLVTSSLQDGMDVVTFSGDKLLGGPQVGIILGQRKYLEDMKRNNLLRALRVDKLTLAALEATLRLYLQPDRALAQVPALRMLTVGPEELEARAAKLAGLLARACGPAVGVEVIRGFSQAGGGSLPGVDLPTFVVQVQPQDAGVRVEALAAELRQGDPAVIGRVRKDMLFLDVRTVPEGDFAELVRCFQAALVRAGARRATGSYR